MLFILSHVFFLHACVLSCFSHVWLFGTLWTKTHQASLSMGFCRQEQWSGLPCPPPGVLPDPGIELGSPALQADTLPSEPPGKPWFHYTYLIQKYVICPLVELEFSNSPEKMHPWIWSWIISVSTTKPYIVFQISYSIQRFYGNIKVY